MAKRCTDLRPTTLRQSNIIAMPSSTNNSNACRKNTRFLESICHLLPQYQTELVPVSNEIHERRIVLLSFSSAGSACLVVINYFHCNICTCAFSRPWQPIKHRFASVRSCIAVSWQHHDHEIVSMCQCSGDLTDLDSAIQSVNVIINYIPYCCSICHSDWPEDFL